MPFQPGLSGNPDGRPKGAKTAITIPVLLLRESLNAVCTRAKGGDKEAQNLLVGVAAQRPEWAGLDG